MSDSGSDPHPAEHPPLDDGEAERQRGEDPSVLVGDDPPREPGPEPDPRWKPPDGRVEEWEGVYNNLANDRRPRREDILPYLLIRATTPGDRGQRPLWPPTPVWESPDILLIDANWTGPFDPGRLVGSPTAGRTYRVFIHVWNLGLFPAFGVHIRGWYVNPGFFNGSGAGYNPILIGGTMTDLDDRSRPDSHRFVELDQPWSIPVDAAGHDCLIASASCPADQWSGTFDANGDRHVAQRNLTILASEQDVTPLIATLGEMIPVGATLEILHAGLAGVGVLQAVTGGRLHRMPPSGDPYEVPVDPAPADLIRHGVPVDRQQHLLTMVRTAERTIFARTDTLAELLQDETSEPTYDTTGEAWRFAHPGDIRRVLETADPRTLARFAAFTDRAPRQALPEAVAAMLAVGDLSATTTARALGGRTGQQHVLRFVATASEGELIGGYTVVVS